MSTDHDVKLRNNRIEIKPLNVVQDVYQRRTRLDNCRHRKLQCPSAVIDISPDRHDRCYRT